MLSKINESNPLWVILDIVSGKIFITIHKINIVIQYIYSIFANNQPGYYARKAKDEIK
jgi:nicotinamide riboside transporter PnuC